MLRLAWSALPLGLEVDGEGCVSQVTILLVCTLSQGPGAPLPMESEDAHLPLPDGSSDPFII